jgi:long-subunit fatty acid transport protein
MVIKQNHIAKVLIVSIVLVHHIASWSFATSTIIEIPGSFNPVGSGARAMGMGGAFMSIADDATASSWNPAALIHLKKPESSITFSYEHLQEKNFFSAHQEASGNQFVSKNTINYLSGAFPFAFARTNMVLAASVQRLYSLSRQWNFPFQENTEIESYTSKISYEQKGDLYAAGLSLCLEIFQPNLSLGITINQWKDGLFGDEWERRYQVSSTGVYGNSQYTEKQDNKSAYSYKGVNTTIGLIWNINEQWRLSTVVKTPFNATVREMTQQKYDYESPTEIQDRPTQYTTKESSLEMPLTWGLGLLYRYHENFYLAADFYETHWHHFLLRSEGREICPLSGRDRKDFQMDRTYQVRLGCEYIWTDPIHRKLIPFRLGFFYDPMPSENNGDDIYGISLGTGWTVLDKYSIDIAYQFRYGNNVGGHYLSHLGFSQDVRESQIFCSFILY